MDGGGSKATKEIGGITVTARYSGTRGNALKVAVLENTDGAFRCGDLSGYHRDGPSTATEAAGLTANDFVVFGGEGPLSAAVATALEGGTNGTANGAAYTKFTFSAVEVEQFNTLCYPGTDSETKGLFVAFTKRLRDDEGKKITCVLTGQKADYEGIINVKNGVVLESGETLPPERGGGLGLRRYGGSGDQREPDQCRRRRRGGCEREVHQEPVRGSHQGRRVCVSTLRTSRPVSSPTSTA